MELASFLPVAVSGLFYTNCTNLRLSIIIYLQKFVHSFAWGEWISSVLCCCEFVRFVFKVVLHETAMTATSTVLQAARIALKDITHFRKRLWETWDVWKTAQLVSHPPWTVTERSYAKIHNQVCNSFISHCVKDRELFNYSIQLHVSYLCMTRNATWDTDPAGKAEAHNVWPYSAVHAGTGYRDWLPISLGWIRHTICELILNRF